MDIVTGGGIMDTVRGGRIMNTGHCVWRGHHGHWRLSEEGDHGHCHRFVIRVQDGQSHVTMLAGGLGGVPAGVVG